MRFHLETECPLTIKIDHTGIIHENGKAPGLVELAGCLHHGAFQQIVHYLVIQREPTLECLVDTVLRPGLGQRLKLNIGRVTALLLIIINDGLKFISGEPELLLQCRPVSGQDIDCFQFEMISWVLREAELFPFHYVLDNGVHQQSAANNSHLFTG